MRKGLPMWVPVVFLIAVLVIYWLVTGEPMLID
jgi:hypothetical protein